MKNKYIKSLCFLLVGIFVSITSFTNVLADVNTPTYRLRADRINCLVYVDKWDSTYNCYIQTEMTFLSSPGFLDSKGISVTPLISKTVKPLDSTATKAEWHYFPTAKCYVPFAVQLQGNYCIHAIPQYSKGYKNADLHNISTLGTPSSEGCIRLAPRQALWIYNNCLGATCTIYDGEITEETTALREKLMKETPATIENYPDFITTKDTKYIFTYFNDTPEKLVNLSGISLDKLKQLNPRVDFEKETVDAGIALRIRPWASKLKYSQYKNADNMFEKIYLKF